jgi:valyl-tRNA synthetase
LLDRLDDTISRIDAAYAEHRFSEVAQGLYDFVWGDFCDRFIEVAKAELFGEDSPRRRGTLATIDYVLHRVLRLLHPFAPFLTEELWHGLGFAGEQETIQFSGWPETGGWTDHGAREFTADFHAAASLARNLRATYNLPANKKLPWLIRPIKPEILPELPVLGTLLHAESIGVHDSDTPPPGCATTITPLGQIFLPLAGLLDVAEEVRRLEGELRKVEAELAKVAQKLSSENFIRNAPSEVVQEHRERQTNWQEKLRELLQAVEALRS